MEYIDIVFNNWIWDEPYLKSKQNSALKDLSKMFSDGVSVLTHVAGARVANPDLCGHESPDLITVYHTIELTEGQKKTLADTAVLMVSKKESQREYAVDASVCFIKLDNSSYYYYPIGSAK